MSAQSSSLRSWGKLKSTMCWSISAVPVRSSGRQLSRLDLEQAGGQVLGRHLRQGQERLGPLYAVDLPDLLEQQPAQVAVVAPPDRGQHVQRAGDDDDLLDFRQPVQRGHDGTLLRTLHRADRE